MHYPQVMPLTMLTLLIVLMGFAACDGSRVLAPVWSTPLLEGEITNLGTEIGSSGRQAMLVEDAEQSVIFYLGADTVVETGNPVTQLSINQLEVGAMVRVWPRGVVVDTDPRQADAGRIVVLN